MTGISGPTLLTATLCRPERVRAFDMVDWERLVWQSRAAELMAQLYRTLNQAGMLALAPAPALRHLHIAHVIAQRHTDAVRSELRGLQQALQPLGVPVLLLKGAAYIALGHPAAVGRIFNDIDIMVPKAALPEVEERLHWAGWFPAQTTAYDERYYREWMHEIPPLQHKNRGTVLDVHHTILPPTSGIRPDPAGLFTAAESPPAPWTFFAVLGQADRVIHSACHLFFGEFHKGLRDLHDLHVLLSGMTADAGHWQGLVSRSIELGLALPVLDALEQCQRLYETPVPPSAVEALRRAATTPWPTAWRCWLFEHALRPAHTSAYSRSTRLAHWLTFVRSHWLRMPLPLLAFHLSHKLLTDR